MIFNFNKQKLKIKGMKQIKRKNTSHTFILRNINIAELDQKYGIQSAANSLIYSDGSNQVTKIEELQTAIDIIPENMTMVNSIQKQSIQASYCFWCRHAFSGHPIGCPITYRNSKMSKQCVSDITKETYIISQSITSLQKHNHKLNSNETFMSDYYETDGVFCSFNCCLSFINDNIHNPTYKFSKSLLMKMYADIFNPKQPFKIFPAPDWKLLKEYGGCLDIESFRKSINEYRYEIEPSRITSLPRVKPIGYIYDKHYIF